MNDPGPSRVSRSLRELLLVEDYPLLAAVVLLPWAFGGVEIWAFRSAAFLVALSGATALTRRGWSGLGLGREARWLLPASLLAVWAVVQLLPLPAAAVGLLSPSADALYHATFPGYPGRASDPVETAIEDLALLHVPESHGSGEPDRARGAFTREAGGRWSGWRPLSLLPGAGVERAFWYCALLLGFLVARERCFDPEVARAYRRVLFALFFGLAGFGLVYAATSNGKLYWIRATLEPTRPFGPYVNPTNFAAVMELATPWLAGMTLLAWRERSASVRLRQSSVPLLAAATLLCLLAGLATASKGAAVLIGASLVVLSLFAVRSWRGLLLLAGLAAAIGVFSAVVLPRLPLGRRIRDFVDSTGAEVSRVDRVVAWSSASRMLRDYAVTGSGFGSFRDVFPPYTPAGDDKRWYRMHNDYLEVVLEGGLIAAGLLAWLAWNYWRRVISGLRRPVRAARDYAALGLALGLLSLSVHAFFDFNHQIPGNALLFVVAAALAVGLAEGAAGDGEVAGAGRALRLALALALLAAYGLRAGSGWIGGTAYSEGRRLAAVGQSERALPLLERGALGEDRSASLWLAGEVRLGLYQAGLAGETPVDELQGLLSESYRLNTEAITLSPASGWYWAALADVYHQIERSQRFAYGLPLDLVGRDRWAFVGRPGRIAVGMLRMAIQRDPIAYVFHDQLAFVLLDYELTDPALEVVRGSARVQPDFNAHAYTRLEPLSRDLLDTFAEASRDALGKAPLFPRVRHLMALGRLEMRRGRPQQAERDFRASLTEPGTLLQRAEARFWLGLSLESQLRFDEAVAAFVECERHPVFEAAGLAARARLAEGADDPYGALELLLKARQLRPLQLDYALSYARVAESVNEWDLAREALRWAATAHPDNPVPARELKNLDLETGNPARPGATRPEPGGPAESPAPRDVADPG